MNANKKVFSRPPIERFRKIARITTQEPTSSRILAVELEVSSKTIERDIEFMRDRLNLPIQATGKGFFMAHCELCPLCAGRAAQ